MDEHLWASVCNMPPRPVQPPMFSGMGNEYWPKGNEALQLWSYGSFYKACVDKHFGWQVLLLVYYTPVWRHRQKGTTMLRCASGLLLSGRSSYIIPVNKCHTWGPRDESLVVTLLYLRTGSGLVLERVTSTISSTCCRCSRCSRWSRWCLRWSHWRSPATTACRRRGSRTPTSRATVSATTCLTATWSDVTTRMYVSWSMLLSCHCLLCLATVVNILSLAASNSQAAHCILFGFVLVLFLLEIIVRWL